MGVSEENTQPDNRQGTKNVVICADDRSVTATGNSEVFQGSPSRGQKVRKDFRRSQHHCSPRDQRRKLAGVRQLRRCENLNFLLSQAEKDEDESGEVDFVDLVSHHNSAFKELFVEQEKMSAWMSFVDSSEEEQQKFLATTKQVRLRDIFHFDDYEDDAADGFESVDFANDAVLRSTDNSGYFAQTASECFLRINRNLRNFLRHSRFPAGELHHLEEELVAFFVEWPSSVYVAHLPDGYRRLMLHAVSQYLDLDARSYDVPGTKTRQTHVENSHGKGDVFVPPPTPLATYIHENKNASLFVQAERSDVQV
jgi:17beta-estradiol 17-dehydrogenase/3beta-hydroxysteroid 3-dehydrogenase